MSQMPLAVLDLAPISEGSTARQALQNTIDLAQSAERWGYRRCWVAEHHFVAVASSSPAVLIALIATATNTIRVGSAAVQIGHHTAAAVVEAFGTIDALHPGRIDLGLGRSGQRRAEAVAGKDEPSTPWEPRTIEGTLFPAPFRSAQLILSDRFTAASSMLQLPGAQAPDFDDQLDDLIALIDGKFQTDNGIRLSATPGAGAEVELTVPGHVAFQHHPKRKLSWFRNRFIPR